MKRFFSAILSLLVLTPLGSANAQTHGVAGSDFHKNDITYSTEVATPHVAWATKLPGGPLRSFFIPSVQYGRDMAELMQRLELRPTTVSVDREWDINCWGIGDYYGHEERGDRDDFQRVYGYVERDLTGDAPFEVMLIPGLNGWSRMTRAARDAVLRRVRDGAGLVLLHPFVGDVKGHPFKGDEPEGDARIWDLSPLVGVPDDTLNERGYPEINRDAVATGRWEATGRHFITDGVPLDLLPEGTAGGSFYRYTARGDVLVRSGDHPVVAAKSYGKGRVVAFGYVEQGFTPESIDPYEKKISWDYWEYQYSLLARALLWASGRETPVRLAPAAASASSPSLRLELTSSTPRLVTVDVTSRSEFGRRLGATTLERRLAAGNASLEIPADTLRPASDWPGGRQILDVIVRDAATGATLDWGSATFQVAKSAMLTLARPAVEVYRRGETLSAVLRSAGDLAGLRMRMRVSDDLGRLLTVIDAPARAERTFAYTLDDFVGKSASVTAELVDARGSVVDQLRAKPVMVIPERRRQKEYTPLVSFGGTKHYLQDAQMRQVRAAASDTGFTWGAGVDNSLNVPRGSFGVYWYDRGPTTPEGMERAIADFNKTGDFDALGYLTKKELYKRTGDKRFLRRTPSFNDRAFMRSLTGIARASARNKARYGMDYYFVGDEGSLTSYGDPFDFDWSPAALDDFRAWLKAEYTTLDALNREWKSDFKAWDAVVPFTTEEARATRNFAPWADHRTFMEVTFADTYRLVRDAVREADPEAHIAVSGTQATNAYNGADWYRLDQVIDDFLSYDGGNQWDMHRSFAKPGAMIGFWTGYGSKGSAARNAVWSAAVHNVLHPNVFWMYSFLNPDLTHSASARDLGEAFAALRFEGVGKLLMESERLQDGIAIHSSMASVHAASILGYHTRGDDDVDGEAKDRAGPSFPADRDGWVRAVNDLGMQFDFVASEQVERGALASGKYKTLILPFSLALSDEEARAVEAFVRAGGTVIADSSAALLDEHCAWRERGALDDLFGISAPAPSARALSGSGGDVSVTEEGARWSIGTVELGGIRAAEPAVKAAAATPLARVGDTDVVTVRRVGGGTAIYLNALFDGYSRERRKNFGGSSYRALLASLLGRVNVRPAVDVLSADGRRLTQAQVVRYRLGDAEVVTVVKDDVALEGVTGRDGVTVYGGEGGESVRQEITVKLPRKAYVTNVRSGDRYGLTDTVRAPVLAGDAVVLAVSPADNAIALRGPSSAALGDHLAFSVTSSQSSPRLVRWHVFAPDGSMMRAYAANVLIGGGPSTVVLPSALNDPAGEYTLRATDLLTGASAESKVTLRRRTGSGAVVESR
jgi:hypothetical protein